MLTSYTLSTTASSYIMVTFSPTATIIRDIYEISSLYVTSTISIFFVSYILFGFIAIKGLEKYGLEKTFRVCSSSFMIAAWGRWLILDATGYFPSILLP